MLPTKESYFIHNGSLYKETDGVAMGSRLSPFLANAFLSYHDKNWLNSCPQGFKMVFYWSYAIIVIIFDISKLNGHLKYSQKIQNSCHINMSTTTFSGVYSSFKSFLTSIYKFGIVYTLFYKCFCIYSN